MLLSRLYCKHFYQYLHNFESSEQELLHFLHEMSKSDFHWKNQYGEDIKDQDENDYNKNSTECKQILLKKQLGLFLYKLLYSLARYKFCSRY